VPPGAVDEGVGVEHHAGWLVMGWGPPGWWSLTQVDVHGPCGQVEVPERVANEHWVSVGVTRAGRASMA
jgi:hypothetical protein